VTLGTGRFLPEVKSTVGNHGKKWQKKHCKLFCENHKNYGKDMASSHGPEDHHIVYKMQHPALTIIITCSAKFLLSAKFCQQKFGSWLKLMVFKSREI